MNEKKSSDTEKATRSSLMADNNNQHDKREVTSNNYNNERLKKVRRRLNFDGEDDAAAPASTNAVSNVSAVDEAERRKARERWNFDFENEIPLEGDWQWEREQTYENALLKEQVIDAMNMESKADNEINRKV